jgi:hypothetical protein
VASGPVSRLRLAAWDGAVFLMPHSRSSQHLPIVFSNSELRTYDALKLYRCLSWSLLQRNPKAGYHDETNREKTLIMITGAIKNQIDQIWNSFWAGGIANPLEVIEQITYLLFIRRLDDLHTLAVC